MNLKRKIYLAVFLVSLIGTGFLLFNRIEVENQSKSAEIVADYEEFVEFGRQLDMTPGETFEALKEAHFTSVAIKEDSLYDLVVNGEPVEYALFKNIKHDIDWDKKYSDEAVDYLTSMASDYDVVMRTRDTALFDRLKEGVKARYDEAFYQFFESSEVKTMVFKGTIDDIYYTEDTRYVDVLTKGVKAPREVASSAIEDMGLGYDPAKVEAVQSAGLTVNLRPSNYYKYNEKLVDVYFDEVSKYNASTNAIIFNGREILSYSKDTGNYKQALYDVMRARDIPVGMIESSVQRGYTEQKGIEQLAEDLEYNVVRVFPVIEYIQQRYNYLGYYEGPIEIENTLYRAITERNIRSIYFRPFKDSSYTYYDHIDEYKTMFEDLARRLEPHGITLGDASVMPYNAVSPHLVILSAWGLLVLGLVILKLVFDIAETFEWILFGVGIVGIAGINFLAPNLSIELFALAGALIYPVLAIIFLIEYLKDMRLSQKVYSFKDIVIKAVVALCATGFISLMGGLTVAAIMSRADYLVEMSYYRGVKVSLIAPIIIFVVVYLIKLGYKRDVNELRENTFFIQDVKHFLLEDIKMYYFFIAIIVAVVGYIYIGRSGHESGVEALNIELIFRNFLENVLLARPRTKEILMAFPALSAAVFFAARFYNRLIFPAALVASLGFTSIVNTFCHARSPIYLSTVRTFLSLGIGIIISIVVLAILNILSRIYVAYFGSSKYE
ncbi:hypothetical protein KHM83_09985 [Fusibacter paucivorans]|uniref:Membrane transport protein MMPL domain-containing protein n=1 Tax=Fusibacter paucivorans TaxID=76009 RepID=A0ABS5PPB1_9FIRM|nr:DUF5693 family protein [Fusibacter paucivorans]MBS7527009.1 hypothetical protein [Fusibacter paucivorans]